VHSVKVMENAIALLAELNVSAALALAFYLAKRR
jgi:hypothetical protein